MVVVALVVPVTVVVAVAIMVMPVTIVIPVTIMVAMIVVTIMVIPATAAPISWASARLRLLPVQNREIPGYPLRLRIKLEDLDIRELQPEYEIRRDAQRKDAATVP
jgi:hypothetical protein